MERIAPNMNALACSLYEAERMVAFSPTWQSLVGVDDWEEARDRICFIDADAEDDVAGLPRPCCVINHNTSLRYHQVQGGAGNYLRPSGDIWIYLAIDVPTELMLESGSHSADQQALRKNQLLYVSNVFGDFIQDLASLAGQDQTEDTDLATSHLGTPHIDLIDMVRTPESLWPTQGQWWWAVISLKWGDGQ